LIWETDLGDLGGGVVSLLDLFMDDAAAPLFDETAGLLDSTLSFFLLWLSLVGVTDLGVII
jgi:hypothetical protein